MELDSISIIKFEQVQVLAKDIKRDGVTLANPNGALWIGAFADGGLVGVVCLVVNEKSKSARFKSDFVLIKYRGHGIYSRLFAYRERLATHMGVKVATAFCGPLSIGQYLKRGFKQVRRIGMTENVFLKKVYLR